MVTQKERERRYKKLNDEQKEAYLCLRAQGMKSIDALQEVEMSLQRQGE
ncbi:MAG: hypothetical protein Q8O17_04455 [Candidatus Methanoperedens sp.]|nr:hypothetical protein [Candidatus Methanoperedens sp.]